MRDFRRRDLGHEETREEEEDSGISWVGEDVSRTGDTGRKAHWRKMMGLVLDVPS